MTSAPFTVQHQLLVNCLGFFAVQVVEDDRAPLMLASMGEALIGAPRNSAMTERLCSAAMDLIEAHGSRNKPGQHADWARAMMTAQAVLADVFQWRAGLALDACRAAPNPKS